MPSFHVPRSRIPVRSPRTRDRVERVAPELVKVQAATGLPVYDGVLEVWRTGLKRLGGSARPGAKRG